MTVRRYYAARFVASVDALWFVVVTLVATATVYSGGGG